MTNGISCLECHLHQHLSANLNGVAATSSKLSHTLFTAKNTLARHAPSTLHHTAPPPLRVAACRIEGKAFLLGMLIVAVCSGRGAWAFLIEKIHLSGLMFTDLRC